MKFVKGALGLAVLAASAAHTVHAEEARTLPPAADITIDYETHIKPLLERSCIECHREDNRKSRLRLDTREMVLQGGIEGPAVVVGDSENSHLAQVLVGLMDDYDIMPPPEDHPPFTDEEVGLIRAWIDQGLVWGDEGGETHPEEAPVPGLPEDWKAQATKQAGPLATWGVIQDIKGPNDETLIGLTAHESPNDDTLNLLWTPKADFKDGDVALLAKATGGARAAGIAWRIKDKDNYFAAVVDWESGNISVELVRDGRRRALARTEIEGLEDWVTLNINHSGDVITVEANGATVEAEHDALPEAGGMGYLTVGDTTAAFTAFKK